MNPKETVDNINCCVYGCHSKKSKNRNLSFHGFPKSGERKVAIVNELGVSELIDRRKAWILKIKTGKAVTKYMKICSLHFKKDDFILPDVPSKRKMLKKDVVPSQNLPVGSIPKTNAKSRSNRRRTTNLEETDPSTSECHTEITENIFINTEDKYSTEELIVANSLLDLIDYRQSSTSIGVQVTSGDIFQSFILLIDSDTKLNTLTGLSSFKMLESIESIYESIFTAVRVRKLSARERIILTFIKLKQNVSYKVLSILFKSITPVACRNIFFDTLNELYTILENCIYWPSKQECLQNMPACFEEFQNVRVVLDCTEILMQKPKCLCCRLKSYSHYKSHNTIKFLCGVSPAGLITFISKGYGGRSSDKSIFEQSKLVEKLDSSVDAVMVDKGFRIDEIVGSYGIQLIRPPFLRKNNPLSKNEVELTRKIAHARVHVERVFQRVKLFKILSQSISWNILPKIDQIFTVCCAITNLSSPVLADDKFLK